MLDRGLDKSGDQSSSARTIVIAAMPEEYVAGLEAVVEGDTAGSR